MEKLLRFYGARFFMLCIILSLFACDKKTVGIDEEKLIGTWKLEQEYNNEGKNTPLKEFPLSDCDKKTTLLITANGNFIEKSYYEDLGTGGECIKDNQDTIGQWTKGKGDSFQFTYPQNENLLFRNSKVVIKDDHLIVTLMQEDSDLGTGTALKFVYVKAN